MSLDSREDLEEERRLFYVAITRAESKLTISYANSRYRWGNLVSNDPSRFLEEIDQEFIQEVGPRPIKNKLPFEESENRWDQRYSGRSARPTTYTKSTGSAKSSNSSKPIVVDNPVPAKLK